MKIAVGLRALVLLGGVVMAVEGCFQRCDGDSPYNSYTCEGDVFVHVHRDSNTCAELQTSRTDCAAEGKVCFELPGARAQCAKPCSSDAECERDAICNSQVPGRSTCTARLEKGASCTTQPTHCKTSLVCGPPPAQWDPGMLDASAPAPANDASANTSDASSALVQVCQEDCTTVDRAAPPCLAGALSTCLGRTIFSCRCGFGSAAAPEPCASACVIAPHDGRAFCALSSGPDPKCQNNYYGSYCAGTARIECRDGYAVSRNECGAGFTCKGDGTSAEAHCAR